MGKFGNGNEGKRENWENWERRIRGPTKNGQRKIGGENRGEIIPNPCGKGNRFSPRDHPRENKEKLFPQKNEFSFSVLSSHRSLPPEKVPTTNVSLFVPLRIWPFSYTFLLVNAVVKVVVVSVAGCFEAGRMQLRNNRGGRILELPQGWNFWTRIE
jgi:hypothetical protein